MSQGAQSIVAPELFDGLGPLGDLASLKICEAFFEAGIGHNTQTAELFGKAG